MDLSLPLLLADRVGVFVFALSGGIAAARKEMDLFGVLVLAFLTAVGGGTLRDLILDVPVFWLDDTVSVGLCAAGGFVAFFLSKPLDAFRPLRWADAAGLALFSVAGAAKAWSHAWATGLAENTDSARTSAAPPAAPRQRSQSGRSLRRAGDIGGTSRGEIMPKASSGSRRAGCGARRERCGAQPSTA